MSDLSHTFSGLYTEVADYLGYGRTTSKWTGRTDEIKRLTNDGYRRFLQGIDPRTKHAYSWSFLRPQATMVWWGSQTGGTPTGITGTTDGAGGSATLVGMSASFFHDSMIGHTLHVGGTYSGAILSVASGYTATVEGAFAGATAGVSVTADGRYSLPSDFGGMLDPFHYDPSTTPTLLVERPPSILHADRAGQGNVTGYPQEWAVQPRTFTNTTGTRFEVTVHPIPCADYTMYYRYRSNPNTMTADAEYPVGGPLHADAIRACALASAELARNDGQAYWQTRANEAIVASIDVDKGFQTGNMGYNRDDSDQMAPTWNRRISPVTYN
ncbi:MAG: hypothetical protein V2A79_14985 [Planctomycetota bacterium]